MRVAALLPALLAAACTVGPDYRPPEQPVPPAFAGPQAAPAATGVPADWWRAFGDPVLDGLVARGLRDNPDIQVAASRIRQARAQEIAARARGRPTIDATASASRIEFSENAGFSSIARQFGGGGGPGGGEAPGGAVGLPGSGINSFALGFDAGWEIDLFGGARRGREAAAARVEAATWTRRDAAVTLTGEIAQAYFALRLDQAQLAVIEAELAGQRRVLQIAENNARVGLVPAVDATEQRAAITATEARLAPISADADVRAHALAILLGQSPGALDAELRVARSPGAAPAVPAGLPSELLRRRADVRAAERELAAATADIGVAVADLYPRLSLTGVAELVSTALGNLFSGDSLQLTGTAQALFPVLDWGQRRSTVTLRREDREQAYLRYRATVLGALRDVEDALSRLDAERTRNAALVRAIADAAATARAREAQYRAGLIAQDVLLDAQVRLLSAREQGATSDAELRQQTVALFKALGGGWERLDRP